MHKEIIIKAFDKARKKARKKGVNDPSNNSLAKTLSDYISFEFKTPIGERRLRDYYKLALQKRRAPDDINITQLNVVIGLCNYLGYDGFEDYVVKNNGKNSKEPDEDDPTVITISPDNIMSQKINDRINIYVKKNKIILSISMLAVIAFFVFFSLSQQRYMVWQEHHYVEVDFDKTQFKEGTLKPYNEALLVHFKKIVPNCNTKFFKDNGDENLWYGKNPEGNLEFFTALGLHPQTGTILKKITPHMIRNHICPSY